MTNKEYIKNSYDLTKKDINRVLENESFEEYMQRTRDYFFKSYFDVLGILYHINSILDTWMYYNPEKVLKMIKDYLNEEMK